MTRQEGGTSPIEIQKYLAGIDYPAPKRELEKAAEKNGAPEKVIEILQELPEEEYQSPAAVMKALGRITK